MSKNQLQPLPTLPRGQGTLRYTKTGKIEYRKSIALSNGDHIRKSVNGDSVVDCIKKKEELEKAIQRGTNRNIRRTLKEELHSWCVSFKKNELKQQPYLRLKSTIKNQINEYEISHYRCHSITALDIQRHLDFLNSEGYSYSVIKKTYDCLNEF